MTTVDSTKSDPILAIQNVNKSFYGVRVVSDFSLTVRRGEFVSILGPSGSGKSALLRVLAGFERPDSGQILLNGQDVVNVPPFQRDTAMVLQHFALFPHMTVHKNIEFGLEMRQVPSSQRTQEVRDSLHMVGLEGLGNRYVEQLSGGQRQRVALARALITRPQVLFLDEPLGALDANLRVKMQAELKRLNKKLGITFILVTGNQSEAMAMSDRLVVMDQGRIQQIGTPHEIFRQPTSEFVAKFIGNFNVLQGKVKGETDDLARVETLSGEMLAPLGDFAPVDGEACAVLVRTDLAEIGEPKPDGGAVNRLTAKMIESEFTGSRLSYMLQLPDGGVFKVEKHRSQGLIQVGEQSAYGTELPLHWPVKQTRLISRKEV